MASRARGLCAVLAPRGCAALLLLLRLRLQLLLCTPLISVDFVLDVFLRFFLSFCFFFVVFQLFVSKSATDK
jgi:hypothetical protein